jgi:hypothetical protein
MSDDQQEGDQRAKTQRHPLQEPRQRFLRLTGTSVVGASLAGCGYGFVAPQKTTPNPLVLTTNEKQNRLLGFYSQLRKSKELQDHFISDPATTVVRFASIDASDVDIALSSRLLLYLLGNRPLLQKLGAIGSRFPMFNDVANALTRENPNVEVMNSLKPAWSTPPPSRCSHRKALHRLRISKAQEPTVGSRRLQHR